VAVGALKARLRKPGWRLVGAVLLAAALYGLVIVVVPLVIRRMSFFRVRRVEVVGARSLEPERVVRALALSPTASIIDPVAPLERRALAVPGVQQAQVSRRLPGALVVTVVEQEAVALAATDHGLALVDARGIVLPFDPTRAAPDLPVLRAPSAAAATILARVRDLEPDLYAATTAAWADAGDVVLVTTHGLVRTDPTLSGEAMHAVIWVTRDLENKNRTWTELDARFAGQIVVRRRAA
jgi:cell division septal protein FtsQ